MVRPFGVAIGVAKRKVIEITGKYTVKSKSSFLLSTFLRGSGTKATPLTNLFCLKEPNKTVFDVWFIVFETNVLDYLVISRAKFQHRN
jgi:hypothetical protein